MISNDVSLFIIGTELTKGIIEDSHTHRLASELTRLGFRVLRSVIVPDDGSVEPLLESCMADSGVIVTTGGLGPTSDDLTRAIIAKAARTRLVEDPSARRTLYERVGERINGANAIQAWIPEGFSLLPNPLGTAPGFMGQARGVGPATLFISLPGPPREMQPMFYNLVVPRLLALRGRRDEGREDYSVYLLAESKLEELCQDCQVPGVLWGTRFEPYKINLYLSGGTPADRALMAGRLGKAAGRALMVPGDRCAFASLGEALLERGWTVCAAESCTGGLLASLLTEKAGASGFFKGGAAVYTPEAKERLALVPGRTIAEHGVYSPQCALAMAEGLMRNLGADMGIAVTGVAGPDGGTRDNPVGAVHLAFASRSLPSQSVRLLFGSNRRDYIRRRAASAAAVLGLEYLGGARLLDTVSTWIYI